MYQRTDLTDRGAVPCVKDVHGLAIQNRNFRTTIWTGKHMQMTLMCIPEHEDIGLEVHEDADQFLRVEKGSAVVKMGNCKHRPDFCETADEGDVIYVPAGTWHNVYNKGDCALKLSATYAPPQHPIGTVHCTKADAEAYEK